MESRKRRKALASKVKFAYFNVGKGHGAVAGVAEEDMFWYGLSLCSPQDNFNRITGRNIARKRLFSGDGFCGMIPYNDQISYAENCWRSLVDCLEEYEDDLDWDCNPSWYVLAGANKDISFKSKKRRKEKRWAQE